MANPQKKTAPKGESAAQTLFPTSGVKLHFREVIQPVRVNPQLPELGYDSVISRFEYLEGATPTEKLAMLEKLMAEHWIEGQKEVGQWRRRCHRMSDNERDASRRLDAALAMIREFGIIPERSDDEEDDLPF